MSTRKLSYSLAAIRNLRSLFWTLLREASGETAYERYLKTARSVPAATDGSDSSRPILSPAAFYLERLEEKYSRPCRCC